jgi:quinol monooxygenase YgiN
MIVTIVEVWTVPGAEEAFLAATLENHSASRQEPEHLRFDVLRARGKRGKTTFSSPDLPENEPVPVFPKR